MNEKWIDLVEEQLDERLDEALAMRFAFMTLARALDESGALRLPDLVRHLGMAAADLRRDDQPGDRSLAPVAGQIEQLRDDLAQLR